MSKTKAAKSEVRKAIETAEQRAERKNRGPAKVEPMSLESRAYAGDKEAQTKLAEISPQTSEEVLAKLNGKAKKAPAKKAASKNGESQRINLLGHPVTAVLRWMGKNGWTKTQAIHACSNLGANPAPGTVQIQLRAGAKGERGDPADLSSENIEKLNALKS